MFINNRSWVPRLLILKQRENRHGYFIVDLSRDGRVTTAKVASLVLQSFVGDRPTRQHQCAHWDGDQLNNRLTNLRWATPKENEADKVRHARDLHGERNHGAILKNDEAAEIRRRLTAGENSKALALEFGVKPATIRDVKMRRTFRFVA